MDTRVLILRHGQSIANIEKIWSGRRDVELSELGIKQAEFAAEMLKSEKIDRVFSSTLKRAYRTALPFAKDRGLDVVTIPDFVEWDGGKWEGVPFDEVPVRFPEEYRLWCEEPSKLVLGESANNVRERCGKALDRLYEENKGLTILLVCHGGVIKTIPSYFSGNSDEVLDNTPIPTNCSITEVAYTDGKGRVERYSDDSYLGDFKTGAFVI
ncbi:MAG: histidine phosphatase family protein [Ruminococcaceae bacterium]|nr:histidine phosphatase family protein [Oscillospiraceae bacterium]